MGRQIFDQWKVPKTIFNNSMTFYVQCDCGELAKKVYGKYYFECSHCGRNYVQRFGEYVEKREDADQ